MAATIQSGVPCKARSGDTIIFTLQPANYPPSAWSLAFILSRNGTNAANIAGTESGGAYTVTIPATQALAPGSYNYLCRYTHTSSNEVESGETGVIAILPNLAANQAPSFAVAELARIETAIATNQTSYSSVNFNGQGVVYADRSQMLIARDRLKAEVIRERQVAAMAAGQNDGAVFQVRFRN